MISRTNNTNRNVVGCFLGTLAIALGLSGSAYALRYGAICNSSYAINPTGALNTDGKQNWQVNQVNGPAACNAFLSHLSPSSNAWRFNWNTDHGEIHALEKQWPRWESDYVESADIMFYLGHGGAFTVSDWLTAGAPYNDLVSSKDMCLGSTLPGATQATGQRGLSVLAIDSCYSLTPNPTLPAGVNKTGTEPPLPATATTPAINFPARPFQDAAIGTVMGHWQHAMSCGLRMINGTWHEMAIDRADVLAGNYGTYLNNGRTFVDAWQAASSDQTPSQHAPATITSGLTPADCMDNLNNLKLSNLSAKGRVTTTASYCGSFTW